MKSFGPQGPQRFAEFLKQINIPTAVQPYPSMALGACELSLYEMLGAYTMFPGGGVNTEPYYIARIEDKLGVAVDLAYFLADPTLRALTAAIADQAGGQPKAKSAIGRQRSTGELRMLTAPVQAPLRSPLQHHA